MSNLIDHLAFQDNNVRWISGLIEADEPLLRRQSVEVVTRTTWLPHEPPPGKQCSREYSVLDHELVQASNTLLSDLGGSIDRVEHKEISSHLA